MLRVEIMLNKQIEHCINLKFLVNVVKQFLTKMFCLLINRFKMLLYPDCVFLSGRDDFIQFVTHLKTKPVLVDYAVHKTSKTNSTLQKD